MRGRAVPAHDRRSKAVVFAPLALVSVILFLFSSSVSADFPRDYPGESIFNQKCKGCHTIGGGRAVGPDLEAITDKRERSWLVGFIVAPDQVLGQGDPLAKQLVQEYGIPMPNVSISRQDAELVLAYIDARSADNAGQAAPVKPVVSPETGDSSLGASLFIGSLPFEKGGPACVACHSVAGLAPFGGGTIAKDLTASFGALGHDALAAVLQEPAFPIMREAFVERPLTEREQAHLIAFLEHSGAAEERPAGDAGLQFGTVGVAGALVLFGIGPLLWRRRLQGVRRPLLRGGAR